MGARPCLPTRKHTRHMLLARRSRATAQAAALFERGSCDGSRVVGCVRSRPRITAAFEQMKKPDYLALDTRRGCDIRFRRPRLSADRHLDITSAGRFTCAPLRDSPLDWRLVQAVWSSSSTLRKENATGCRHRHSSWVIALQRRCRVSCRKICALRGIRLPGHTRLLVVSNARCYST